MRGWQAMRWRTSAQRPGRMVDLTSTTTAQSPRANADRLRAHGYDGLDGCQACGERGQSAQLWDYGSDEYGFGLGNDDAAAAERI